MAESLSVSGIISSVVFRSDETGYAVIRLCTEDGGELVAVGCIPYPGIGEYIEAVGIWETHSSYGEQLKITSFSRALPSTADLILEYLSSGTVRGIGRKTAEKIVDLFGDDSLCIIANKPNRLCEVAGITAQKARQIGNQFEMQNALSMLMEFINKNGIEPEYAVSLFKIYGQKSLEAVNRNPYIMSMPEIGVQFYKIDKMALDMGFDGNSEERVNAAVIYELQYNSEAGHSFIPREKLTLATAEMLSIPPSETECALDRLISSESIVEEKICGVNACYLTKLYDDECYVANTLCELQSHEREVAIDCEDIIRRTEQEIDIEFEPLQRKAIELAVNNHVFLLTGGPGTGKTTVIKGMLSVFEKMNMTVLLAAPTGRAAKRMTEFCGTEAKTVHRLLEMCYNENSTEPIFERNAKNPLETDVLIIDETSMVDISLMAAVLRALPKNCTLVLIGDADQLPSIGPGNVFKDLLNSDVFAKVILDRIFRQAAQSDIIVGAHSVNHGSLPDFRKKGKDLFFMQRADENELTKTVMELCRERLPKNMNIPSEQIQVLSVSRKNMTGTKEINRRLQACLNPPSEEKTEKKIGDKLFRVGDRVMQIRNNYTIEWFGMFNGEVGYGVFNGDIGEIVGIDGRDETITVNFDSRLVHYPFSLANELELAYAMTVHKSQGSEFRAVILVAGKSAPVLWHRSVLYTAMTRARELLIIVGEYGIVKKMVENNKQRNRYSALKARVIGRIS